jgi:hypothetical protein
MNNRLYYLILVFDDVDLFFSLILTQFIIFLFFIFSFISNSTWLKNSILFLIIVMVFKI